MNSTFVQRRTTGGRALDEKSLGAPNDFLVVGLETIQPAYAQFEGKMYAGALPMDNGNRTGDTQFWLFRPETQTVPDTIVLWLNGGPGCSSFNCGVLMENSPVTQPLHAAGYCCLKPTPQMDYNEHTWTRATTMLYVEHPIGTGFSTGNKDPETEAEASTDLDAFLQNFFTVFDDMKDYKFFVTGESYAGMFIPSVGKYLNDGNKKAISYKEGVDRIPINLSGLAIGNGWIDAKIQGPATVDYSWWHGLIDKPTRDSLLNEWEHCMMHGKPSGEMGTEPPPFHEFNVQDDCGIMWGILQAAGNPNAYDISTWDPNVDQVTFSSEVFYNDPLVKEALHVLNKEHTWHGCQAGSGRRRLGMAQELRKLYMNEDRPLSVVPYIAELLDDGLPIVVYNGDRDMTTNMVGTELCLNGMEWSGADGWLDAPRGLWKVDDYPAGWVKEYKGLTFAVVYNSGHMVPYNVPNSGFDLLTRLLTATSFLDDEAPQIRIKPAKDSKHEPMTSYNAAMSKDILPVDAAMDSISSSTAGNDMFQGHTTDNHIMFVALVATVLGFMMGAWYNRPRSRGGYQAI